MNQNTQFDSKWDQSLRKDVSEEFSAYVKKGDSPKTQRQLFLFQYYLFIKDHINIAETKNVLEMGCGRGTVSMYFSSYDKAKVTLTDISENAIKLAKENLAFHGVEGNALVANADEVPFDDCSFDLVYSIGLLEHLDDYDDIVREKFRVLQAGGTAASLNIPKKTSIQVLNTIYRTFLKLFGRSGDLKPDYYRNNDRPERFVKAFERAGFSEIKVFYVAPFPIFTPLWKPLEYLVTLVYRGILFLRSIVMRQSFVTNRYVSQAHFIIARKPE